MSADPKALADAVNHAIYIDEPSSISQMTLDQFRRTHDVNLVGSFLLLRAFLQGLERAKEAGDALGETVSVVLIGSTGRSACWHIS